MEREWELQIIDTTIVMDCFGMLLLHELLY